MNRKPKIALMSYAMDNREAKGTALYTRKLIERLANDGRFDIYLVHYDHVRDPLYERTHEILMPNVRLPFATRFARQLLFFWKYREERFDVIHWFQPRLYPFFWFAPAKNLIATLHGAGDITAPAPFVFSKSIFNLVLKYFNWKLHAIIAVSEFAKDEIAHAYGASTKKIHAIYNGGGEDFRPLAKSEACEQVKKYGIARPYILDVSRLEPSKNVGALVRAYDMFRREGGTHMLVVAGFKGFSAQEVFSLAKASPYATDIMFINFVEQRDLNALYSGADLFVFPSLNEGFGLPVVEAFASGTPVVTSRTTALPEITGGAALLVDSCSERDIADAMRRVLSDDALRRELITKGLARARRFTWQRTADRTIALYEALISGHQI